ncbi:hypothetical protein [Leptospira alstonii]|uniref:Uncharacterized protein n=2 Tax=Leptospira alstonii TaxID=28452 RepID=M6CTH6_9LEPT|nr:hypothetical protein [Leptospira alstonii]EMJ95247.1 hypothetical protein LEP1GSC194_0102 [Leptospira alstonii serovar Sichuan str. 79601]EQA81952.1 hypothetical protein LEP1GSC193_0409 [Leptospira alstonii serovar Pingchang str. 80-412]
MNFVLNGGINFLRISSQIRRGILLFKERYQGDYELVSGNDASNSKLALVKENLITKFISCFGGEVKPSLYPGWKLVIDCLVKIEDSPPNELKDVYHLARTGLNRAVRLLGGIRADYGFFAIDDFLPKVFCPDGKYINLKICERTIPLEKNKDNSDLWIFPSDTLERIDLKKDTIGTLEVTFDNIDKTKTVLSITLEKWHVSTIYAQLNKGNYLSEGLKSHVQNIHIENDLSTIDNQIDKENDLLKRHHDITFLGPACGDFSPWPRPNYDWASYRSKPGLLCFIGNPEKPTPPKDIKSDDGKINTRWSYYFKNKPSIYVRRDSEYLPIWNFPKVKDIYNQYSMTDSSFFKEDFSAFKIREPNYGMHPSSKVQKISDAIAAISTHRGGMAYKSFYKLLQEHFDLVSHSELMNNIMRSWIESGSVDLFRRQGWNQNFILAKRPRFIKYKLGPLVRGVVIGLITTSFIDRLRELCIKKSFTLIEKFPLSQFSPLTYCVEDFKDSIFDELSKQLECLPATWLEWPIDIPEIKVKNGNDGIKIGSPIAKYDLLSIYSWEKCRFVEDPFVNSGELKVEKLYNVKYGSAYQLRNEHGVAIAWSYFQNPILLLAYQIRNQSIPFERKTHCIFRTRSTLIYLPLAIGRLCTVAGYSMPSPLINETTKELKAYCYPLGHILSREIADKYGIQYKSSRGL